MARRDTVTGGRPATAAVVAGRAALSIGRSTLPEPDGFRWTPLSDLALLESGHTPSRSRPDYWDGDIPWIGIRDATGNHGQVIHDTLQHVTQAGIENSSARVLPANTVCLSRTASVGYVVQAAVPMATSQDFVNWICGADLSPSYLRYLLLSEQASIRTFAYGSVHQTMYYPDAKALWVLVPARPEQDAIVDVLGALDDKIAANTKLASTARALGMAAFRLATAGASQTVAIGEIATLMSRGITPRYTEAVENSTLVLNQKCVREQRVNVESARRTEATKVRVEKLLQFGDVLVNSTGQGTLGRVARWTNDSEATVDTHVTIVRFGSDGISTVAGFAMLLSEPEIEALGEGSTGQTELSRAKLASVRLALPVGEAAVRLGRELDQLVELEDAVLAENRTLAATRDALLPHLMSGKVRVRDFDAAQEA